MSIRPLKEFHGRQSERWFQVNLPCAKIKAKLGNLYQHGDIAQLIERSIRIAEVEGLSPSISTKIVSKRQRNNGRCRYFDFSILRGASDVCYNEADEYHSDD